MRAGCNEGLPEPRSACAKAGLSAEVGDEAVAALLIVREGDAVGAEFGFILGLGDGCPWARDTLATCVDGLALCTSRAFWLRVAAELLVDCRETTEDDGVGVGLADCVRPWLASTVAAMVETLAATCVSVRRRSLDCGE